MTGMGSHSSSCRVRGVRVLVQGRRVQRGLGGNVVGEGRGGVVVRHRRIHHRLLIGNRSRRRQVVKGRELRRRKRKKKQSR